MVQLFNDLGLAEGSEKQCPIPARIVKKYDKVIQQARKKVDSHIVERCKLTKVRLPALSKFPIGVGCTAHNMGLTDWMCAHLQHKSRK